MTTPLDASTVPVSVSLLTASRGNASKRLIDDGQGLPALDPTHSLGISAGVVKHLRLGGLPGLRQLLENVTTKQALIHGVPHGSAPDDVLQLLLAEKYTGAPGTIARTQACFSYGSPCVLMFDYDPDPAALVQVESAAALMTHLTAALPALRDVGYLSTVSTRSAIRPKGQPDAWLTPPRGMHVYVIASGDVARFRDILKVKLWCTGMGFAKLAHANVQTGVASILERALLDLTVFSPERLDYVAGALIDKNAPFYQDRPPPELHAGCVLDLDALPDLTDAERQEYARRLDAARALLRPEQRETVRQVVQVQLATLPAAEQEQEITRRIEQAARGELAPDHQLVFAGGPQITAGELAQAAHLDGKRLADPMEPTYGPADAVFHWNKGAWRITSWAHGGPTVYRLEMDAPPPPTEEDWDRLMAQTDPQDAGTDARPVIKLNTDITAIVEAGEAALLALPDAPVIYQRARALCAVMHGVKPPKWLHRAPDLPVIQELAPPRLWELASQAAHWLKYDKRSKKWEEVAAPGWLAPVLQSRGAWDFPSLEGIICSPTLRPDGSLLDTPGYDPSTGLYLDLNGTAFPPVPTRPGIDDARTAVGHLHEVLIDFPFKEPWHFSAALAAILSMVCRFTVMGCVPLFAIRAHTRASGKSLLGDVLSMVGSGRAAPRWPQVVDDEEERKRLLTVALAGYPALHIDNVTRPLGSPALNLALTSSSYSDRVLGKTESREAPLNMVWLASGNNMQFLGDTARRVVPVDLDPRMERPEERTDFQHSPLKPWVERERPRLVAAALTIVQAYFTAGCPAQGITAFGSFEAWSDLIRQSLVWAGEADPNGGRTDIEAESDPEYERLATLLDAWEQCYGTQPTTLKTAVQDIALYRQDMNAPPDKWDELFDALGAIEKHFDGKHLDSRMLGEAFSSRQGRLLDGKRLVKAGTAQRATQWKIERV